jgi:hypothetical protein
MSDPDPYPQIQCCGIWIDYPKAGESTSCPECKSVFALREETTKAAPHPAGISDDAREVMQAIHEVLDVTPPPTIGDEPEYLKLLARNVLQVQIMIKSALEREGRTGPGSLDWGLAYLREHAEKAPEWHVPEYMRKMREREAGQEGERE